MANKLTDKQARFVEEYLIDLNATQAAIRAGYSEKTAQEQSSRLLSNVMVKEAVERGKAKTANKLEITRERVLQTIAEIAFEEIKNPDDPELNLPSYADRLKANDMLSRHLGLFEKDNDQRAPTIIIGKDDAEL